MLHDPDVAFWIGVPAPSVTSESRFPCQPTLPPYNDQEPEDGVTTGDCPFVVHGILGNDIINKCWRAMSTIAIKHLKEGGSALAIGHSNKPKSIFSNPSLYLQIFPWLFLYGLGGIQNDFIQKKLSPAIQKKHFLLYHNKQIQTDKLFPIVAFNHEQIAAITTGTFLLIKKLYFNRVCENIMSIDRNVLDQLSARMLNGEHVVPETSKEQKCFSVLKDVDSISAGMDSSLAGKRKQRGDDSILSLSKFGHRTNGKTSSSSSSVSLSNISTISGTVGGRECELQSDGDTIFVFRSSISVG